MKIKNITCMLLSVAMILVLAACGQKAAEDINIKTIIEELPVETEPPVITSVNGVMTAEEVQELGNNKDLLNVDLSGSTCYDAIMQYIYEHPEVEVVYTVDIGGTEVNGSTEELDLKNLIYTFDTLVSVSKYLPKVSKISLDGDVFSADDISAVSEAFPEADIAYSVTVLGKSVDSKAETIDLSSVEADMIDEVAGEVNKLPNVKTIDLMANGTSSLTLDDVKKIHEAVPQAALNYDMTLFEQTFSLSAESIEYVKVKIGNEGLESFRELLPLMPNCKYLKLDSCDIDYELLAELREDFPDVKVVWRVYFSNLVDNYNCLTDTEKIWATGSVTDGYVEALKYCTDVKYIDMGHNCITNIEFVNYMPKLEVAVFSITWVYDISPLGNCPDLEFLEMYSSNISNISALANCKNLKHLNLGNDPGVKDITALYDLDLERCYININSVPDEQEEEFKALHPNCECSFDNSHPVHTTWRFLPGYVWAEDGSETHYNERYALLREQIGYDTMDYSK